MRRYNRGKNRLFVINKKLLIIAGAVLAAIAVIVGIVLIVSSGKKVAEKNAAIERITAAGVINAGLRTDLGPLCMFDSETNTYKGLEKDIADNIISRIFGNDIIVNFVEVNSETKDALLLTGDLDISLGASVIGSTKGIDYSKSFYTDGSAFLVRKGEMTNEGGLAGSTIAVVQGSVPAGVSSKDKKTTNIEYYLKSYNLNATVKVYASYPEAVEALRVKYVTAVCASENFLKLFGRSGMVILPERFIPNKFCVETRTDLEGLRDAISEQLTAMENDGTLDALIKNYDLEIYTGS
jgi:aspartate/glutamate/glutamine transport system substrate-binding protein